MVHVGHIGRHKTIIVWYHPRFLLPLVIHLTSCPIHTPPKTQLDNWTFVVMIKTLSLAALFCLLAEIVLADPLVAKRQTKLFGVNYGDKAGERKRAG